MNDINKEKTVDNETSQFSTNKYFVLAIFILIIGLVGVLLSGNEVIGYIKGYTDLNVISSSDLEDIVYGEIELSKSYVYGCYDISYSMKDGVKTPETYYYIVYVGDYANADAKFFGIEVGKEKITRIDAIVDESWEAIKAGAPLKDFSELKIDGKFKKMTEDGYTNFLNTLTKMGIENLDVQNNTIKIVLDENGKTDNNMFILFGTGGILLVAGIIWIICLIVMVMKKKDD